MNVLTSGVCYKDPDDDVSFYLECFGLREGNEPDTDNTHWSVYLMIALLVCLIGILGGYLLNKKVKSSQHKHSIASIQSTTQLLMIDQSL